MSETPSNNRIQCPGCGASLVVSQQNPSPYIRCGVCDVLFELRSDTGSATKPKVVDGDKKTEERSPRTSRNSSPYGNTRNQNVRGDGNRSREVVRITEDRPRQKQSGLATFFLIVAGLGVLFYFALSKSVSIPPKRSQHSVTYLVDQHGRPLDVNVGFAPRHEISLNAGTSNKIDRFTTAISLDGRNWTRSEINSMHQLRELKEISYTGVKIQPKDLDVIHTAPLIRLNLSRSNWKRGQLVFNANSFPMLLRLDLSYSSVQGFALSTIRGCRHLTHLNLRGTAIEDSDLKSLERHKSLTHLDLCETKVTYQAIRKLDLNKLESLKVSPGTLTTSQQTRLSDRHPNLDILVVPKMDGPVEFQGQHRDR